jgi:hypothetical protein
MVTFSSALSKIDRTARFSRKIGIRSAIAVEMSRRAINSTQNAKLVRLTMPGFPAPVYSAVAQATCRLSSKSYWMRNMTCDPHLNFGNLTAYSVKRGRMGGDR